MKKFLFVLLGFLILANFTTGFAETDAEYQLRKAISLIESGDFDLAQRRLKKISQNFDYPEFIKREASYYIGYCHVKNGDPWRATEAFEDFLLTYDSGSQRFVPDALYVMGRAYEEIGEIRKAKRAYQRVYNEFSSSEFARKARIRLKELGGSDYSNNSGGNHSDPYSGENNNNGGYNGGSHSGNNYGVSYEIRRVLRYAKTHNNSYLRDQYILENIGRSENGSDLVALITVMENDMVKGQFCDKIWGLRFAKTLNAATIVEIASQNKNSYLADQFLLQAAQNIDFRTGGYSTLAEACDNSYIRSQILEIAKDNVSGNNGGHGDYNHGNYNGGNGVSRPVREIIRLARLENNSFSRDQFLLDNASKGNSSSDFIAMLSEMSNDAIKGQFLDAIQRNRAFKTLSARAVVDIAAEVSNSYSSDQFLLAAAEKIAFTFRDYRILAEACSNGYTKSEILRIAEKSNYGNSGHGHGHYLGANSNELEKPVSTDPFASYKVNKSQVARVNKFIKAVETKKGMNEAVRKLKSVDMKILTVKEYMEKYQKIMDFERLHSSN